MTALDRLERAELLLAQASNPEEFAAIRGMAEAARVYARQVNLGTRAINHATRIKLLAERGLADAVDEGQEQGVIRTQEKGRPGSVTAGNTSTLADIGVSAKQVSEARLIRDQFSAEAIESYVDAGELARLRRIEEAERTTLAGLTLGVAS